MIARFVTALLALLALPALAQAPAPAAPAAAGDMTLARFEARHEHKLMALDTDGDGRISRAEFLAAGKGDATKRAARFARLDRNGDGMIDRSEIDARLAHRFQRLDTDHDGVLSLTERAAARHKRAAAAGAADRAGG